jgi:hypothetical protein
MSDGEEDTAYAGQYFITGPRFETGDERYDWLNTLCSLLRVTS